MIAEDRLLRENIDDPGLLYKLTRQATGNADLAEDMAMDMLDRQMREHKG